MKQTLDKLVVAIKQAKKLPSGVKAFVITETEILRLSDGRWESNTFFEEFGYARVTKLDRGKILSVFAKMEFIVNECLNLHLVSPTEPKSDQINLATSKLSYRQQLDVLSKFEIITGSFAKRLQKLNSIRNHLAHEWDEKTTLYNGKKLTDPAVLDEFSIQLCASFKRLVTTYSKVQKACNYKEHLESLCTDIAKLNSP